MIRFTDIIVTQAKSGKNLQDTFNHMIEVMLMYKIKTKKKKFKVMNCLKLTLEINKCKFARNQIRIS